jgi:probable rRNA maturation factor
MHRGEGEDAIEVEISDTQGHLRVDPDELAALVRATLAAEGRRRASISIALVDQSTIHAINRSHLGHDWPTDVISFPFSDETVPTLAGELVVSAEMAAATAAEIGVEPRDELALYVIHGLLHLCGYDDLSGPGAEAMRRREDELLKACGRSNPFDRAGRRGPSPGHAAAAVPTRLAPHLAEKSESSTWSA